MKEQIPGGLASGKKASSFDPKALAAGVKVEMEHTKDPKVAREIASDHLTEDPKYYEKLARMEKSDDNGKATAAIRALLKKNPKPDDSEVHALAGKLGMEVDDLEEKIYSMLGATMKKSGIEELGEYLEKAGRPTTPEGGKTKSGYTVKMVGGRRTYIKETKTKTKGILESEEYLRRLLPGKFTEKEISKIAREIDAASSQVTAAFEAAAKEKPAASSSEDLRQGLIVSTPSGEGTVAYVRMSEGVPKSVSVVLHAKRDKPNYTGTIFPISKVNTGSKKTEKSMSAIDNLDEHLEKAHKYIRKEGTGKDARYFYKDPSGKERSVGTQVAVKQSFKEGTRVNYQGQSGTVKHTQGDLTMVEFDGSGTTAEGILTERLKPEVSWPPGKEGGKLGEESKAKDAKLKEWEKQAGIPYPKTLDALTRAAYKASDDSVALDKKNKKLEAEGKAVDTAAILALTDRVNALQSAIDTQGEAAWQNYEAGEYGGERPVGVRNPTGPQFYKKPAGSKVEKSDPGLIYHNGRMIRTPGYYTNAIDDLAKALPSAETDVTPEKASKILHDGEVHGKPLTDQQRKFFGAIASKGKKTEKSMSALDQLNDHITDKDEPLEKGMIGGYGMDWANRCVKRMTELDGERAEIRKKYPYGGCEGKDRVERAKLSQKRDDAYEKISAKENAESKKQADIEAKYLDWRIEQAKGMGKSEDGLEKATPKDDGKPGKSLAETSTEELQSALADIKHRKGANSDPGIDKRMSAIQAELKKRGGKTEKSMSGLGALEEHIMKSEMPTGQPTNVSGGPENGGPLDGKGKNSGTSNAPQPDPDQDADGNPQGVPTPKGEDWSLEAEARKVLGGPGGTMKSMGSLEHDQAVAERNLSKGEPDVHPLRMSAVHGDTEARVASLSKAGTHELDPRNAIIAQDVLCKSCKHAHPAMLTACPNCGDGTIGREVLYKSNPGVILEDPRGRPLLKRLPVEKDIEIKE